MDNSSLTQSERQALKVTGFGPTLSHFLKDNSSWLFNLIFSHLLFWMYGLTAMLEYGYSDLNQDDSGRINSGPSGSGVGIITALLTIVSTVVIINKAIWYNPNSDLD